MKITKKKPVIYKDKGLWHCKVWRSSNVSYIGVGITPVKAYFNLPKFCR